jgi:hypothetical protein
MIKCQTGAIDPLSLYVWSRSRPTRMPCCRSISMTDVISCALPPSTQMWNWHEVDIAADDARPCSENLQCQFLISFYKLNQDITQSHQHCVFLFAFCCFLSGLWLVFVCVWMRLKGVTFVDGNRSAVTGHRWSY